MCLGFPECGDLVAWLAHGDPGCYVSVELLHEVLALTMHEALSQDSSHTASCESCFCIPELSPEEKWLLDVWMAAKTPTEDEHCGKLWFLSPSLDQCQVWS